MYHYMQIAKFRSLIEILYNIQSSRLKTFYWLYIFNFGAKSVKLQKIWNKAINLHEICCLKRSKIIFH